LGFQKNPRMRVFNYMILIFSQNVCIAYITPAFRYFHPACCNIHPMHIGMKKLYDFFLSGK
ncbi:hypothetical protein ACWXWI_22300, partial [Pantoea ananatis]